jgi:Tfp pilus assembly protein PilN
MIRINLLPAKFRRTKGAQRVFAYVVIGLSALGVALVLLLLGQMAQVHRVDRRIAQIDAALAKQADKLAYLGALTERERTAERLRALIRSLQPEQALWLALLDDLARLVREDLWLTRLASQPVKAGGGLTLTLDGEAYTKISVADFLEALEGSERFREVRLLSLTDVRAGSAAHVAFKLQMRYALDATVPGGKP